LVTFNEVAREAFAMHALELADYLKRKDEGLLLGIPREITSQERRVPSSPSSIAYPVHNGHEIMIESKAGAASNFSDSRFSEAGAIIAQTHEEIFQKADVILKIEPPTDDEIELMRPEQLLISALQLDQVNPVTLNKMLLKRINAVAYKFLQDDSGSYPIIRAMGEMAGDASVLLASEYLNNANIGKGELL